MTTAANNYTTQLIDQLDERIKLLRETINERLMLKDRWITDHFIEIDKRFDLERSSQHERLEMLVAQIHEKITDLQDARRREAQLIVESHLELHRINDLAVTEFKVSVQQRLNDLTKLIDTLREERNLFVLRDSHDTKIGALEKQLLQHEKSTNERLDAALLTQKEFYDGKIAAQTERHAKLEQSLQVMNARNQQSIIALGILLTLVEIIIRFYN